MFGLDQIPSFKSISFHIPVILAGLILFSTFLIPSVHAGMGNHGSAKRCIEIIYNMIYETSSPKVGKAFRRSIAQCYAETMWDDMVRMGCRCNSEFDLECAKRAAARAHLPPHWHYRAVHYYCLRMAQKEHGVQLVK